MSCYSLVGCTRVRYLVMRTIRATSGRSLAGAGLSHTVPTLPTTSCLHVVLLPSRHESGTVMFTVGGLGKSDVTEFKRYVIRHLQPLKFLTYLPFHKTASTEWRTMTAAFHRIRSRTQRTPVYVYLWVRPQFQH